MNLTETKSKVKEVLSSWQFLCEFVMQLDEESALYLMNYELRREDSRASIVRRCYSRYSYLRSQRERKQLKEYFKSGVVHGYRSFEKITKFESTQPGNDRL